MKRIVRFIYSIYAFVIFIILMFLLLPIFIIANFLEEIKAGNTMYDLCRIWADGFFLLTGIFHKNIFEAPKAIDHPVIFVFNHISYIDIPIMMKTFRKQPIRILAKAEMAKVPIFGYIYKNAAILVDRNSDGGRAKSVMEMKRYLAKNISIVIAPEGTFNMTNKPLKAFYNGAFTTAVAMQTPIQPVIFLDAYDRLSYKSIFSFTAGKSRAIFLPEIKAGENAEILKQKVYTEMETALIKHKASWIKT